MTVEILHRYTKAVLYRSVDAADMRAAVLAAVKDEISLKGAYLTGANLAGANLARADLAGAYLAGADLATIRADVRRILASAPAEVSGLLARLRAGRFDGTHYEGECSCLLGSIAAERGCSYQQLGIRPDSTRPAERFAMAIREGATPESNPAAKILEGWIVEWLDERAK